MARADAADPRIAIIGGGAAGTIVASELARRAIAATVHVYEPRADVGPGLAYSTTDPQHLVNVPAGRLSAVAGEPDHLLHWLEGERHEALPQTFVERRVYGRYLRELFADAQVRSDATRVGVRRARVRSLWSTGDGIRVDTEEGTTEVDQVVLALGNVQAPPAVKLPADRRVFASPWDPGALRPAVALEDQAVLIVGTGLTAVDAALSLAIAAPGARLVMVSHNGQLPFAHLAGPLRSPAPHDSLPTDLHRIDDLVAAWSTHLSDRIDEGYDWRSVVDGIRPITQQLWRALDTPEQARFLREHRRAWEARRNRAAPRVGAHLEQLASSGRLEVVAGGVSDIRVTPDGIVARIGEHDSCFARVVSCTGPTSDVTHCSEPLLRQLFADGIAVPDPHKLAVTTDHDGRLVGANGSSNPHLWTLGWMRRGELWESLAIAEIRDQAARIAELLA
jgi:uncharacterized NAD(P)/FAD-binding protein YdhS